jgi:hypothetical protein
MPFVFLFPTIYNLAVSSFSTLNPSNYVSGCKTINSVGNEYDLSPLGKKIVGLTYTLLCQLRFCVYLSYYKFVESFPGAKLHPTYTIFSCMCMFCRSLFVLLYFFFWPLCCLFFFDIRILISPLHTLLQSNCHSRLF